MKQAVDDKWLKYEHHQREHYPNHDHQPKPPERRIEQSRPGLHFVQHVEAGQPGQQNREARLRGETALERLKGSERRGRVWQGTRRAAALW